MLDAQKAENSTQDGNGAATRWRGRLHGVREMKQNGKGKQRDKTASENVKDHEVDSETEGVDDVDIVLIQRRTYLLSAGIGDTNRAFNKYKGKLGLVVWIINIIIHFSLDFYEATTIFDTSWATCIGLFFVTLVACCISMIKYSIPWFIRGVKKLKRDGHYPKTLRRVQLVVRYMPFGVVVFAVGAAIGQFGCYWADGALKVNFNPKNSTVIFIPSEVETLLNILRATSLVHIFYGFCSLLLFHLTLIFMIQSSMHEYNDRMGKLFREVPINICFSDAVNLFSARAKFVREGSEKSSVVLTTLLVACCTSFVLNAYNFLFLKKHAIYIWFALAPLIWAVVPLMGAAWVTKTYNKYKLVVVNAWVDIPDEHELEAQAHEALHQSHASTTRPKTPVNRLWGSNVGKTKKKENAGETGHMAKGGTQEDEGEKVEVVKYEHSVKVNPISDNPTILFTDCDDNIPPPPLSIPFRLKPTNRKVSDSSISEDAKDSNSPETEYVQKTGCDQQNLDSEGPNRTQNEKLVSQDTVTARRNPVQNSSTIEVTQSVVGNVTKLDANHSKDVCIDIEPSCENSTNFLLPNTSHGARDGITNSNSNSSSPIPSPRDVHGTEPTPRNPSPEPGPSADGPKTSLEVPSSTGAEANSKPQSKSYFLSGMAKTFHRWRTKTKKNKKFNYEKYITYLESILPTVGFAVGGVIITWNGIYTFIVLMTFLVGVFAQEAFFGN